MQGKRVYYGIDEQSYGSGEYGKTKTGVWYVCPPQNIEAEYHYIGNLKNHTVVEHEDGTITVSPSILITSGLDGSKWHGYLEKGVWREC